jgi:hypothetical protein
MKRLKPGAKKKPESEKVRPITVYVKNSRIIELGGADIVKEMVLDLIKFVNKSSV